MIEAVFKAIQRLGFAIEKNTEEDKVLAERLTVLEKLAERQDFEIQRMYAKLDRLERLQEKGTSR